MNQRRGNRKSAGGKKKKNREHFNLPLILLITTVELVRTQVRVNGRLEATLAKDTWSTGLRSWMGESRGCRHSLGTSREAATRGTVARTQWTLIGIISGWACDPQKRGTSEMKLTITVTRTWTACPMLAVPPSKVVLGHNYMVIPFQVGKVQMPESKPPV